MMGRGVKDEGGGETLKKSIILWLRFTYFDCRFNIYNPMCSRSRLGAPFHLLSCLDSLARMTPSQTFDSLHF
jgi:hypothetical protein